MALLTTRFRAPNTDDWKNFFRMVRYLCGTIAIPLTLSADSVSIPKWWVGGSHAIHPSMRGHSGDCMYLGCGIPINTSTKQKLNTRSSNDKKLAAAYNFMTIILYTKFFFFAQVYSTSNTVFYQDNKSVIMIDKNGNMSSSKRKTQRILFTYQPIIL